MKKSVLVFLCIFLIFYWVKSPEQSLPNQTSTADFQRFYEKRLSNQKVTGEGVVFALLPYDRKGLKHQRFILQLPSGQKILIAHNSDIAKKITLRKGDKVMFKGIYEWNSKGGVVHWTHHDPRGKHVPGWLIYDGQRYQ